MNSTQQTQPTLLSLPDARKFVGNVSTRTLRNAARGGALKVIKIGRKVFVTPEELERVRREGLPSRTA